MYLTKVLQSNAHPASIVYYLHLIVVNMVSVTNTMDSASVHRDGEELTVSYLVRTVRHRSLRVSDLTNRVRFTCGWCSPAFEGAW